MRGAFYITGTDTGVGKTRVSVALIHAIGAAGLRVAGMKPLASGCEWRDGRWRNEDADALLAASMSGLDYQAVNPFALPLATAPEIAAAAARVTVSLDPIASAFVRLGETAELRVVEGVGGWLAPLAPDLMQADLVRALQLPVLLVVGLRLGCINHALLSERALRADGVPLLGWIGSAVDSALAHAEETRGILATRLTMPCLGILEHGATRITPDPWPALQAALEKAAP